MFDLGIFEISLKDFNNPIISVGEASGKNALKDAVQNAIEGRDFIKLEKGFAIFIKIPPGITKTRRESPLNVGMKRRKKNCKIQPSVL